MSAAAALLAEASAAGVRVRLTPDGRLRAPADAPPGLLARLRERKAELAELLGGGAGPGTGSSRGYSASAAPGPAAGILTDPDPGAGMVTNVDVEAAFGSDAGTGSLTNPNIRAAAADADPPAGWAAAASWDARAWWERFEERAGLLEHDGGLPRREAGRLAYRECALLWQLANPPPPCAPDRCAGCGGPVPASGAGAVPVLRTPGPPAGHLWLHAACLDPWRRGRAELARSFLAGCSVGEPA